MIGSGAPPAARSLTHPFADLEQVNSRKNKRKQEKNSTTGGKGNYVGKRRERSEARCGVAVTGGVSGSGVRGV